MMKKNLIAVAVAAAISMPAVVLAADAASPHTFTANVGVVSDYLFRGISQTHGKPAIQGGIDYSHSSGIYVGTWLSSISWVGDAQGKAVPTEIDVYAGYKNAFGGGDWNYDVGFITYNYPGTGDVRANGSASANSAEVYGSIGWKWLSAKYSYATSKNFIGWYSGTNFGDTKGSDYLELNANYDLGNGWGLIGHVGTQKIKGYQAVAPVTKSASYTDYKIGVTKDIGFGVVGLAYSATSVGGSCNNAGTSSSPYCWGVYSSGSNTSNNFRDAAQSQAVVSFTKSF